MDDVAVEAVLRALLATDNVPIAAPLVGALASPHEVAAPPPPHRTGHGAYSSDVRWLVVWKRFVLGKHHSTVTAELEGLTRQCQNTILQRFLQTGDVETWQGQGAARPHRVIDAEADLFLLGNVLDDTTARLSERATSLRLATGKEVHISTLSRAMRRLGMSRQRVRSSAVMCARDVRCVSSSLAQCVLCSGAALGVAA